jgi:hypothetical protein
MSQVSRMALITKTAQAAAADVTAIAGRLGEG